MTSCVAELDAAKARLARWTSELARHEKRMKALHPATSQTQVIPAEDAKMVARLNAAVDADETICQADLERAEAAAAAARKEVGRLSCLRIRRGPTGGFCLRRERPNRGGNDCLAPRLAAALVQHAFVGHAVTVLDLGADWPVRRLLPIPRTCLARQLHRPRRRGEHRGIHARPGALRGPHGWSASQHSHTSTRGLGHVARGGGARAEERRGTLLAHAHVAAGRGGHPLVGYSRPGRWQRRSETRQLPMGVVCGLCNGLAGLRLRF